MVFMVVQEPAELKLGAAKSSGRPGPEARSPELDDHRITNAYKVSPAPTTTYCPPSSAYVIGPLLIEACSPACQIGVPFPASSATKLADASPAKRTLPAVLSSPERTLLLPVHLWLQAILPVR